jgi:hypothetical protein
MQHRQTRGPQPYPLRSRRDLYRGTSQHSHPITRTDAQGGQTARHSPSPLMNLAPATPNRSTGLTGHQATITRRRALEHQLNESAHRHLAGVMVYKKTSFGHLETYELTT